jgi:hypothetical protein
VQTEAAESRERLLSAQCSRLLTAAAWRGTGTHDGVGDLQRDESETN